METSKCDTSGSKGKKSLKRCIKYKLDNKVNRIRILGQHSRGNEHQIFPVKSCEYYLRERNMKASRIAAKLRAVSIFSNLRKEKSSLTQVSKLDLFSKNPIFKTNKNKTNESKVTIEKSIEVPHVDSIFNKYINKFLIKCISKKCESSSALSPTTLSPQIIRKNDEYLNKIQKKSKEFAKSHSDSLFNRLERTINLELEKSVIDQKRFDEQMSFNKNIKRITENLKKFRPTRFETRILSNESSNSGDFEINKLQLISSTSKRIIDRSLLCKCPSTYSSTSMYQKLYRQFNKKD